jgi:hypothetical protein
MSQVCYKYSQLPGNIITSVHHHRQLLCFLLYVLHHTVINPLKGAKVSLLFVAPASSWYYYLSPFDHY